MLAEINNRIRARRVVGDKGFTLTELLVVIVIIGILVAIAIPVFLGQREAAFVRAVESDVRNSVPAIETYYADGNQYPVDFVATSAGITPVDDDLQISVSDDVTLTYDYTAVAGETGTYTVTGTHSELGTARSWVYDSETGNIEEEAVTG
jgi:type IV pilus assembly protein PilA